MILVAYHGSDDARSAIEHSGSLMTGQPALVVTVWESYIQILTRYPAPGALLAGENVGEIDDASRETADDMAVAGAALARAHGLAAFSEAWARENSIAETLLAEADRAHASAIVIGSRGLGGLGPLLLGGVSHALIHHAERTANDRPVAQAGQKASPAAPLPGRVDGLMHGPAYTGAW